MSSNAELTIDVDSHPSFILKFEDGEVTEVDTALIDTDSQDDATILGVDHGSGTDSDGNVIHRYNITLREGTDDSPNVDLQRSWESDSGEVDDSEMNVSMDHRSWGDES